MRIFDAHADTLSRCWKTGESLLKNTGHLDISRMRANGLSAQFFACFWESGDTAGLSPRQTFLRQVSFFQDEMERYAETVTFCRTAEQIEAVWAQGKQAALLSVEGGELLNCDPDKLEEAYQLGVRAVNLTWNRANALAGSHAECPDCGLTDRGRAFAERMLELGMLIDVSHLSDPGFWDVYNLCREAEKSLFASHSNARAICFHTRNLTDAQFAGIIETNGVAGLNLHPPFVGGKADLDAILRHVDHWFDLGGGRNLALGGDWDGIPALPDGIRDVRDIERLANRLLQRNYTEEDVDGIFWKNLMRVVMKVCTM